MHIHTAAAEVFVHTHMHIIAAGTMSEETSVLLRDQEVTPAAETIQTRCDICSIVVATSRIGVLPVWGIQRYNIQWLLRGTM